MSKKSCKLCKAAAAAGRGSLKVGKGAFSVLKTLLKILWPVLKILGIAYLILFIVFYFDLDGKLLYTVVEPNLAKHYDKMERPDNTKTPYGAKEPV